MSRKYKFGENPVESGFVTEPWKWKYSSARNYCDDYQEILKLM